MKTLSTEIARQLRSAPLPAGLWAAIRDVKKKETVFEQLFVEPVVVDVVRRYEQTLEDKDASPRLEVALHGWKPKGIRKVDLTPEQRARGDGWKRSKQWSVMHAWGRHTPDIAIRDRRTEGTLVVEAKFGMLSSGGLPTGELQRLIGQCVLAKLHHSAVVAVFGYRGSLSRPDHVGLGAWFASQGIDFVTREITD